MNKKKSIVIATGGTGGHIFPAQAVAEELSLKNFSLTFMGKGLETNPYFQKASFPVHSISSSPLSFRYPKKLLEGFLNISKGAWEANRLLKEINPSLLLAFGSFYTFPILAAAFYRKIPVVLHEANVIPGRVNRLFSSYAKKTAVHFSKTSSFLRGKTELVKMPLRKFLKKGNLSKKEAAKRYGFSTEKEVLLILGGSQGALSINEKIFEILKKKCWPFPTIKQVIHLMGKNPLLKLEEEYEKNGIKVSLRSYEENMDYAWSLADLSLCRAGASTIAEAIEYEVPLFLIPFPFAKDDHQTKNAEFFAKEIGGGDYLEEKNWKEEKFFQSLTNLYETKEEKKTNIQNYKKDLANFTLTELIENFFKDHE